MSKRVDHFPRRLDDAYPRSYALLSDGDPDTAVVFVHGFWGDSKGTWLQFQWMIDTYQDEHPWWKRCDLYFYDYPSFSESIENSAHDFLEFLDRFFPRPPGELLRIEPDPLLVKFQLPEIVLSNRTYRKLVLIGHSQGAIVLRRSVLIRSKKLKGIAGGSLKRKPSQLADEFEMLLARLALFAPAIRGFAPSSWVGALLKVGRLAAYADPILHFSTAFVEMERTTLLNDLRDDTYKLSEACPWIAALKATILFGRNDHIVAKGEYLNDVIEEPIEDNQGHTSICKPTPSYRRPLYFAVGTHGDPKTRGAHSV